MSRFFMVHCVYIIQQALQTDFVSLHFTECNTAVEKATTHSKTAKEFERENKRKNWQNRTNKLSGQY